MNEAPPPKVAASMDGNASVGIDGKSGLLAMGAVGLFFGLKILVGMALIVQSARALSVAEFGVFSQLFLFLALLSTVSAGGVQSGLIRQIATAGGSLVCERRSVAAAMIIWAGFGSAALLLSVLAATPLSELLVGNDSGRAVVPVIAAAALGAGGGQLLCAVLTGRGRAATSLTLQGIGLAVGGAVCWWRLSEGDAQGAVLGYTVGPLVTLVTAFPLARRCVPHTRDAFRSVTAELRLLVSFSGAFLVTATAVPATLFALRYVYRLEFGEDALGYWLAANRVSDVTSQLLGLFMGQIYLPAAARQTRPTAMRVLAWRTALIGLVVMGAGAAIFTLFAPWLVTTFLSAAFLPAVPFIIGYLVGDTLRVVTSLTLHTALARGRLRFYVGIEIATAGCIAVWIVLLTTGGYVESAYWGYAAANATLALLCWVGWRREWWK